MDKFEIKTGYFANLDKYLEEGLTPISIARFTPQGISCVKVSNLAPSEKLLNSFKGRTGAGSHPLDDEYEKEYISQIKPQIRFALEKIKHYKNPILLCYEANKDECHRTLLANYINENFPEYEVNEYEFEKTEEKDISL